MLKKLLAFTCLTLSIGANAAPVTWTFDNVVYDDGSTTVGSFTYDADLDAFISLNYVTTCITACSGELSMTSFGGNGDVLATNNFDGNVDLVKNDFNFSPSLVEASMVSGVVAFISNANSGALATTISGTVSAVPVPAAAWLFGSALLGLGVVKRKKA